MGLKVAPDDQELLKLYEIDTRDYLDYTLHELPAGVLYDANSSNIEGCDELLQLVAEYKQACQKIAVDRHEIIDECRFYYSAYKS